jgi:DNA (cytosine-5)-methyltransferase 1
MSKQDYRTPPSVVQALEGYLGCRFTLDAAATEANAICRRFISLEQNALRSLWGHPGDIVFCNPPFKHFGQWIAKGYTMSISDRVVCMIGPVGCSQTWFHKYAKRGTILVPTRRICYLDTQGCKTRGGDRDSMIYIFGLSGLQKPSTFRVRLLQL